METNHHSINIIAKKLSALSLEAEKISEKLQKYIEFQSHEAIASDHFVHQLTVFMLASIVGYFVVWKVTPALHTPLMSITNAISGIIIIGALLVAGSEEINMASILSIVAIFLSSVNIFGGFVVTKRMLNMFSRR
ncbi:MAG: NAD(P) transhydrogenase subunit alpha [Alphaproteobacteria bacterium]|nr:NAD(P) transhydrogenase subunit alpha [Alphaproteobacteria bacterium]